MNIQMMDSKMTEGKILDKNKLNFLQKQVISKLGKVTLSKIKIRNLVLRSVMIRRDQRKVDGWM